MGTMMIWYDNELAPAVTTPLLPLSAHHSITMADLLTPAQRERGKELCERMNTTVQAEATAMFGPGVNFYQLNRRSARALVMGLERRVQEADNAKGN